MIRAEPYSWKQWAAVAPVWNELAALCSASFFVSAEWVEAWLEVYGPSLNPRLLIFRRDGEPLAACLLVRRLFWRKVLPMRRLYLNCAGEDEADSACVEYNRLLCAPGAEAQAAAALRAFLGRGWDELALEGMEIVPEFGAEWRRESRLRSSPYVDLAALRALGQSYDSVLSVNARQQIRRAMRLYEETSGPLTITQAGGMAEALRYFEELATLHQNSWTRRGKPGVFASPSFLRLHRLLIERGFGAGRVHLLRVAAGEQPIGLLHCFFHEGRVYFYQSGFAYTPDNRAKPGLVTHYMAVNRYLAERPDVAEYDLLAGDSQYKRSLAKQQRTLEWVVVQRPTMRVRAFALLSALRSRPAELQSG